MQSKATATLRPSLALPKVQVQNYVVYIFFAVVLAFFAATIGDKGFLSVVNLFNIARTTAMITVIAVAMTFVISAGELDLSVGSTAALAALTCGLVAIMVSRGSSMLMEGIGDFKDIAKRRKT